MWISSTKIKPVKCGFKHVWTPQVGRFAAKDRHGGPEFWNRRRLPFAMKEQVFEKATYGLIEQGSRKIIVHHTQVEHHFGEFHSNIYIYNIYRYRCSCAPYHCSMLGAGGFWVG